MPPRSRARTAAGTNSAISAVLQDSTDLLAEILNQVAAQQGLRTLARAAPVCKIWLRVALPLAPTWDALLPLDTLDLNVTPASGVGGAPVAAAALHRDKSHKVSFVAALPPPTVAQGVPLLAASVGKDILMLSQQTGTPHAEVETGAGVWPTGLACDGQHLFVAGMLKCTIYKLTLSGGDIVEAQGGFGDCGSTAEARESAGSVLHSPQGLALHGSTLFIADSGNCRVAVWDTAPALRYRYSIGRRGSGDGQLLRPSGLAVDAEHVYVADSGNHRVCKFTRAGAFCLAVGGYGEAPGCFRLPRGVALCGGHLLVSEEEGCRVQVLSLEGVPRKPLQAPAFGRLAGLCVDAAERRAYVADREKTEVHVLDLCFGGRAAAPDPPRSRRKSKRRRAGDDTATPATAPGRRVLLRRLRHP